MEITSLKCNNCGANLEINPKIKYFNCTFCGSSLTIKKSENVMYTEVIEDIKSDTNRLVEQSDEMPLEKKIARLLDSEWMIQQNKYSISGKNGDSYHPEHGNFGMVVVLGIGAIIFGIFWMFKVSSIGAPSIFPIFGLFFIGIGIYNLINIFSKKESYDAAKRNYLNQRNSLLSEMEKEKKL